MNQIRKATPADVDAILLLYEGARAFMRETGNSTQWTEGYPSREVVMGDMAKGCLYVCEDGGCLLCVFYYAEEEDPTYHVLYGGTWENTHPYGVIHRIAVAEDAHGRGIGGFVMDACFKNIRNLRVDTHRDNLPMQRTLLKNGFRYCGIIHLQNGDERLAYQRTERTSACTWEENAFPMYLMEQVKKHPSMQPQDVVKMCYQAAYGAEHMLLDPDRARTYLEAEYATVTPQEGDLYEAISPTVSRVNLAVWKQRGYPLAPLFQLFLSASSRGATPSGGLETYLQIVEGRMDVLPFSRETWQNFITIYRQADYPPVHHSESYRDAEHPAYRIVDYPLLQAFLTSDKGGVS